MAAAKTCDFLLEVPGHCVVHRTQTWDTGPVQIYKCVGNHQTTSQWRWEISVCRPQILILPVGSYPVKAKGDSSLFSVIQLPVQLDSCTRIWAHKRRKSVCLIYNWGHIVFGCTYVQIDSHKSGCYFTGSLHWGFI